MQPPDETTMAGFRLTKVEVSAMNWMSAGCAIGSFALCLCILVASWLVYRCPAARSSLDRISFRLLLWTMAVELLYDVSYTVCVLLKRQSQPALCTTSVLGIMVSTGITNYLVMCVALNLCLVLVFGVAVAKFERFYVLGSFLFGTFIPVIPAAKGSFGWDPVLDICWIRADTKNARIVMLLMSLYVWQITSCLIALLFVTLTIVALYHRRAIATELARTMEAGHMTFGPAITPPALDSSIRTWDSSSTRRVGKRRSSVSSTNTATTTTTTSTFRDRFVSVAFKVLAYPFALIIVNGFIAAVDLRISVKGSVDSKGLFVLYVIYYFFYGARGGIFAAIVLFVDPSLRRGMSILMKARRGRVNALEIEAATVIQPHTDVMRSVGAQIPPNAARSVGWEDISSTQDQPPSPNDIMVTVDVKVELEEVQENGRIVVVAPPHLRRGYPAMPLAAIRSGSYASQQSPLDPDLAFQWELPSSVDTERGPIPEEKEEEDEVCSGDLAPDSDVMAERRASSLYETTHLDRRQHARDERDLIRRWHSQEEAVFRLVASQL